jgi:hypothetical protein
MIKSYTLQMVILYFQMLMTVRFKDMNDCAILQTESERSSKSLMTPVYSDTSSLYEDENESCEFASDDFGPTKMRFIVIVIASVAFFFQVKTCKRTLVLQHGY